MEECATDLVCFVNDLFSCEKEFAKGEVNNIVIVFYHEKKCESLEKVRPITKFFYFITGLGHQSVVVFFVLSGYLIAGSVITQIRKGKFDIKIYALKRLSRLYAVLIFAILLTVVLDHTGIYLDSVGLYKGKIKAATLGFSIADRLSFKYVLTSLFMLQTILLPPIGSNSP